MIAFFDCFSGISGDMTLGAFVDLGVPVNYLIDALAKMPLSGFSITESRVMRHGIAAKDICVTADESTSSRDYALISKLIGDSPLSDAVKRLSLAVFEKIAVAEAAIHNCPKDHVHFHEVGGIDALVDIVGTALCAEYLGIERFIGSPIPLGCGFVKAGHGVLPVPAPATLEIIKGIPVCASDIGYELVTPTGAAILVTLCSQFQKWPTMKIHKIGYGAGKRDLPSQPNVLRIVLGEGTAQEGIRETHEVVVIETCIDDMNPEIYGYLMESLFSDGVLDVFWTPVYMKKNRPGTLVTVLCTEETKQQAIHRILTETSTSGVRVYEVARHTLVREKQSIQTRFGPVDVKKIIAPGGKIRWTPEYEACRTIAVQQKIPLHEVYQMVEAAFPILDKGDAKL
jgi:pyridinium-3,5-bisthiocarboxylic acid mononucleotide nickel chelatase